MIINKTRKRIIASKKTSLRNVFLKSKGLMFSKKIKDSGLIFVFDRPRKSSMHMFFVFFPIDVLFLDSKKRVVEIKENFRPFAIYYPKKEFSYVVELPDGMVKKSSTKVGDLVGF